MSNAQKVIKYTAFAIAASLIISIFTSIIFGISFLANIFSPREDNKNETFNNLNVSQNQVYNLDIDIEKLDLIIKKGNKFEVQTSSDNVRIKENATSLVIEEKFRGIFSSKVGTLIVYVPESYVFNEVSIETGVGNVEINDLTTRKLEFDFGAGKSNINNLNVLNEASLNGGAGSINISDSFINNLDLDVGVGTFNLSSVLTGVSDIDAGVGKLTINVLDILDNYRVSIDKGIGSATLNGNTMNNNTIYGTGSNVITIDGGVGSIAINFQQ